MRIAIVENTAITHHGQIGVALHERAARIQIFRPWSDGILPGSGDHDALVVLGGEQNALSDDTHPYLPALARLMCDTGESGRAVLGICLGAQLLARGLGAVNHIGTAREFGWLPVTRLAAAVHDPVLRNVPPDFPIFEWHSDTFTLPPGATHLATTATAPVQAFRAFRATYGMQFHFEANRAVVADWSREFPHLTEAISPGWSLSHPALATTNGAQADHHGLTLARAWVDLVQTR